MSLVSKNSHVVGPIREPGSELGGDFSFESLEGVEY